MIQAARVRFHLTLLNPVKPDFSVFGKLSYIALGGS